MESRSEIVDRIRAGYDVAAPKISDFAEEHRAREESSLYYCRLKELCRGKHLRALEIGVGGGFLSIFLARLGCEMTAVDNSDGILAQARRNFAEAGVDVDLRKIKDAQDLDFPEGTFDLIVSNPPYVASMDILTLDSSVRDYEPLGALDGGEDGLMFYRAIVRHWTQILRPGGWLMFEVGEDQADAVMALMTEEKYTDVTALEDTAGIRRVVVGRI